MINHSTKHGIRQGQRVLIYTIDDEEIIDPDTKKSLVNLELVKGSGKIAQVEPQYAIVESDQLRRVLYFDQDKILEQHVQQLSVAEETLKPFDKPPVGGFVRAI